jgi:hypothetical protein
MRGTFATARFTARAARATALAALRAAFAWVLTSLEGALNSERRPRFTGHEIYTSFKQPMANGGMPGRLSARMRRSAASLDRL